MPSTGACFLRGQEEMAYHDSHWLSFRFLPHDLRIVENLTKLSACKVITSPTNSLPCDSLETHESLVSNGVDGRTVL